jgi:ribosomal protein S4
MSKLLKSKLKSYRRNECNVWQDLRLKPIHCKTYEYISRSKDETEHSNVGKRLTLRMDLRGPKKRYKKKTLFGLAFRQKQVIKQFYGNLSEYELKKVIGSVFSKKGGARENLVFDSFERRLDVILFRSNFVKSMKMARQWILQGFVYVNNVSINSFSVIIGINDVVSIARDKWTEAEINVLDKISTSTFFMPPSFFIECNFNSFEIMFFDQVFQSQLHLDVDRFKYLYGNF